MRRVILVSTEEVNGETVWNTEIGCVFSGSAPAQGQLESRVSRVTRPAGELHDLAEQITPGPV